MRLRFQRDISGAPKVRALQIIAELEQPARSLRRSVEALWIGGNHDSRIGIRTALIKDQKISINRARVLLRIPFRKQYDETVNKAKGMLKAVELAERLYASKAGTKVGG